MSWRVTARKAHPLDGMGGAGILEKASHFIDVHPIPALPIKGRGKR
jgi:hypothetical protein